MPHVFHRNIRVGLPVAAGADGIWIDGIGGRCDLDAAACAPASCLGDGHPAVNAAKQAQLDRLAFAHTSFFTTCAVAEVRR